MSKQQRLFTLLIGQTGKFDTTILPVGFRYEDTPSHGYYYVSKQIQATVPASLQMDRYEEDCDWAIPVFFNRHLFTRQIQQYAIAALSHWHWEAFEQQTGICLEPGESDGKDDALHMKANIGKEYVTGAFGDWCFDVPKGFVYVCTSVSDGTKGHTSGQPGGSYLIETGEYRRVNMLDLSNKFIDQFPSAKPHQRNETYYTWDDYNKAQGVTI